MLHVCIDALYDVRRRGLYAYDVRNCYIFVKLLLSMIEGLSSVSCLNIRPHATGDIWFIFSTHTL